MENEKALTQTKLLQLSTALSSYVEKVSDVRHHPAIIGDLKASISEAMQSPPVRQLINCGADVKGIEQVLAVMVLKYAKMLHIGGTIGTDEPLTIAKMLIQEYPLNSLDDFNVMFMRGVMGRYGKVMGFDISVIFGWALMFQDEWASEREKLMDKPVEPEPAEKPEVPQKKIDVDKLLAEHLETLRDTKMKGVPKLTPQEIKQEGQSEPPRKKAATLPPTDYEYRAKLERMHKLKIEYGRLYTESTRTGFKVKEGAPSFEEYIKQQ